MNPGTPIASAPAPEPTVSTLTAPLLGSATHFAVLAGSTVTSTGATLIQGNLGLYPGTSITGFPPGLVTQGTVHAGDALALQAQTDLAATYVELSNLPCTQDLTGQDLGGMTLVPGVYCFDSSAGVTGNLALDAQGNADAIFVFQIGSTLITAGNAVVEVVNGGSPCNVYWQVGSSATLGTSGLERGIMVGHILALTSITLNTGAQLTGGARALNGAVTLDGNAVSKGDCRDARPRGPLPDGGAAPDAGATPDAGVPADAGMAPDAGPPAGGLTDGGFACTECGAQGCVDVSSNASACGACGVVCQQDYHCVGGSCAEVCE